MSDLRKSRFSVTINPNAGARLDVGTLAALFDHLQQPPQLWDWLQSPDGDRRPRPLDRGERRRVDHIRIRVGLESEGAVNRSVHAHALVEVEHRTRVTINAENLRALVDQFVGGGSSVRSSYLRSDADVERVLAYLSKTVEWNEF